MELVQVVNMHVTKADKWPYKEQLS